MKRKLLLFGTALCSSLFSFAQIVTIPDANFKAYLVGNTSINTNMDTEIQVAEAQAYVGMLNCPSLNIADMTGVEAFPGLTQIRCYQNQITSLDVSQNTNITQLHCYGNQITTLDLSANLQLTELHAAQNDLTNLIIGANTNIWYLDCAINDITSLDISSCSDLNELYCHTNNLSVLDVSQNSQLTKLMCHQNGISNLTLGQHSILTTIYAYSNSLSSIDLTQCPALEELSLNGANGNNISSIDLTQNPVLTILGIGSNNISSLDISQNPLLEMLFCTENNLTSIDFSSNPNMIEIDCDNNAITSLDLSNQPSIDYLDVHDNSLTSLNVASGGNTNISTFNAVGNINLTCIQVDDSTYSATNWTNIDAGASFSEDCNGGVGFNKNETSLIEIYPNPVSNILHINSGETIEKVTVMALSGQQVAQSNSNSIEVFNLESGVYILKIDTKTTSSTTRFIKQ